MNPTEKMIEDSILQLLTHKGYFCYRNRDQAARINGAYRKNAWEIRGPSDLTIFLKNVPNPVLFLEIKTPKGKQSRYQVEYQQRCEENGVLYRIARSAKEALEIVEGLSDVKIN